MTDMPPVLWTRSFLLACIANFLMAMSFYLLMPTLPFHLLEQLRVDPAKVGGILSIYVVAALLARPFSGFVVDRFSARRAYLFALLLYALFTSGYLLAHTVLAFVIVRLGIGASFALLSTAGSTQAINIIPSQRRGEGIGLFGLMSNLAMAMGPLFGLWLMDRYPFEVIFQAALVCAIAGLAIAALLRSPQESPPAAARGLSLRRFVLVQGLPLAFNLAVIGLGYGMLIAFAAVHGRQLGIVHAGMFFTLMALGMIVSRVFSGRLIDRGNPVTSINGGTAAIVLGLGLMSCADGVVLYLTAALLAGFGFGVVYPAYQTMMVNIGGHAHRGAAVATYYSALDVGVGLGMLIAGAIAARFGLASAFAAAGGLALMAGMVFALRLSRRRIASPANSALRMSDHD